MENFVFTTCRICREVMEKEKDNRVPFSVIVAQIKEVIGVELINVKDESASICVGCTLDLKMAQDLRRKCIESNEFFELKFEDAECKSDIPLKDEIPSFLQTTVEASKQQLNEEGEIKLDLSDSSESFSDATKYTQPTKRKKTFKKLAPKKKDINTVFRGRKPREKTKTAHICDKCGNSFKVKHSFLLHLRRHTNDKHFDCELCSSSFYTNTELKRHMRKHTGEKPYECQYCHRRFSDYSTHLKHERTHTNDRPFNCDQCGKSFSCCFILKNHMLIHTGEKPFRCEVCNKSFGRQHNLTQHIKTIYHKNNVFRLANKDSVTNTIH